MSSVRMVWVGECFSSSGTSSFRRLNDCNAFSQIVSVLALPVSGPLPKYTVPGKLRFRKLQTLDWLQEFA